MQNNNDNRIDKSQYKQAVQQEKQKLMKQVIFLTIFAALISLGFFLSINSHNPYTEK